jgi:hypothetical protein
MDNIGVRITADASGVAPGVAETKGQLTGLEAVTEALNSTFASLGTRIREAFTGGAASAKGMTDAIKTTEAATVSETAALGAMVAKIHEGAESVRTFQMRAKEFAEVYVAMFAVEQIAEFINKMGEAAERVNHLSQQFGMSVAQVQQLGGIAAATGVPVDALTKGMGLLDRNMANAAMGSKNTKQALDAVGVSLNDGRNQMQKLEAVADKFSKMEDGPKKAALAMQLFGRSGRELIPVLNLGSAGIEQLNQKMNEYGVINEGAVEKGMMLAESTNETKLGMQGLENVLMDALAPALTKLVDGVNEMIAAFVKSYEEGGIVAILFGTISAAIKIAIDVIEMLGSIFAAVWDAVSSIVTDFASIFTSVFGKQVPSDISTTDQILNVFKDTCVIVADAVKIFVTEVKTGFEIVAEVVMMAADVATQALLSVFGKGDVQAAWNRGMNQLVKTVHDGAVQIQKDAADMAAALQAAAAGKDVHPGSGGIKLPGAGKDGSFDYNPTGPSKKAKKEKGPSELDVWKQQLSDMLLEEKNWGVDEAQFSEAFWEKKLTLVKKGSKEEIEIRREINRQKKTLFKEEQTEEIAGIKQTEALQEDAAKTEIALAKDGLNEQLEVINQKEKMGQISATKAVAERNAINRQLLQLDMKEADEEYQIKLRALQEQLQLEHLKPAERAAINRQIELLEAQHNNRMLQMQSAYNAKVKQQNDQLVDAYVAKWKAAIQPITSALGNAFNQLITRQTTFKQAAIQAADSIVQSYAQKGIQMLENWIANKLGMQAADKAMAAQDVATQQVTNTTKLVSNQTTNAGQIMSDAAVASAAAFASTAAIPIVGPAMAPGAAAAAYGAVMGMAPMAFAEQGFDVPWGQNPLTQLHQEEMVLPAHLANPLRDALAGGFMLKGGVDRGAMAGRDAGTMGRQMNIDNSRGDVHLHHSPTYPSPGRDVDMDHLLKHEGDRLIRFVKKAHRDGKFN